jgi:hypothetical protein
MCVCVHVCVGRGGHMRVIKSAKRMRHILKQGHPRVQDIMQVVASKLWCQNASHKAILAQ